MDIWEGDDFVDSMPSCVNRYSNWEEENEDECVKDNWEDSEKEDMEKEVNPQSVAPTETSKKSSSRIAKEMRRKKEKKLEKRKEKAVFKNVTDDEVKLVEIIENQKLLEEREHLKIEETLEDFLESKSSCPDKRLISKFDGKEKTDSSRRSRTTKKNLFVRLSAGDFYERATSIKGSELAKESNFIEVNESKLKGKNVLDSGLTSIKSPELMEESNFEEVFEHMWRAKNEVVFGSTSIKDPELTKESKSKEVSERMWRAKNVLVFGVQESKSSDVNASKIHDVNKITSILKAINPNFKVSKINMFRLGSNKNESVVRPIKIILNSEKEAISLLRDFARLPTKEGCLENIKLANDRTPRAMDLLAKLRKSLEVRQKAGETNLTIKYINGTPNIVKKPNILENMKLANDRTPEETELLDKLRKSLEARQKAGETNLTIKLFNGTPKIVTKRLEYIKLSNDDTPKENESLDELRKSLEARQKAGETNLTIKSVNGTPKIIKKTKQMYRIAQIYNFL